MSIEVPPPGTRGVRLRCFALLRAFNALSVWLYRRGGGKDGGRAGLLLTTVGARTGKPRTVALGRLPDGDRRWLVIGSLAGAARHPAWFLNLARNPDPVWVEMGRERFKVRPELLKGEERAAAGERIVAVAPGYAAYQRNTDREIPLVGLTRE